MNYFEFIKHNDKSIEELREYFQVNFSDYYDFCVQLDETEPSFPFDKNTLAFKISCINNS